MIGTALAKPMENTEAILECLVGVGAGRKRQAGDMVVIYRLWTITTGTTKMG